MPSFYACFILVYELLSGIYLGKLAPAVCRAVRRRSLLPLVSFAIINRNLVTPEYISVQVLGKYSIMHMHMWEVLLGRLSIACYLPNAMY
ncbi:hypothetical protein EDB19DRAFT_1662744 [Suillus lakei]|nr:hypothetical protein EDB19DRAFT_1662744 [Suillus lakei]